MNITEILDDNLAHAIRVCSHDCFHCHGAGRRADHRNPIKQETETGEGRVYVMIWPWVPCDECRGLGAVVATIADPGVQNQVSGAVLGAIVRARADGNFGTLNEAIDWYERFLGALLEIVPQEAVEAWGERMTNAPSLEELLRGKIERIGELAREVGRDHEEQRNAGALTPEELHDLGLEPEGT